MAVEHQVKIVQETKTIYPWKRMEKGDYFLINANGDPKAVRQRVAASANSQRVRRNTRFKTKTVRNVNGWYVLVTRVT